VLPPALAARVSGAIQLSFVSMECCPGLKARSSSVSGVRGIAESLGITEFVIGATIVAIGTSVPELATTLIAKLRGHDEIGLGTVLGSNIFNRLWIVPVAAFICPIEIEWREVAIALAFGALAMLVVFPSRQGLIGRKPGYHASDRIRPLPWRDSPDEISRESREAPLRSSPEKSNAMPLDSIFQRRQRGIDKAVDLDGLELGRAIPSLVTQTPRDFDRP